MLQRDTGTFRAVSLDKGGFITSDGKVAVPVPPTPVSEELPPAQDLVEEVERRSVWNSPLTVAVVSFVVVGLTVALLVTLLVHGISGHHIM